MNIDIGDANMNISLQELKQLLIERQRKVDELTHESKGYVSTLKKNKQSNRQAARRIIKYNNKIRK
jgi:hypothetical protein